MPGLLTDTDPDGLLEYSVVYTDRSLNHMSQSFQAVMNDISTTLKQVYNAEAVEVDPAVAPLVWKLLPGSLRPTKNAWLFETAGLATAGRRYLKWVIFLLRLQY